jgi:uncharacterized protein YbbC (DUF1343 family)
MRKLFVLFSLLSILFISCQKEIDGVESPSTQNKLQGEYKLISIEANTIATQELTLGSEVEKLVVISHYITKENKGTIKFDATTLSSINMSYSIDTVAKGYLYASGILIDSLEIPVQFALPPSNTSSPYKMVGADSIYFSGGAAVIGNEPSQQGIPGGAKLKFDGDKLYMISRYNNTTTTIEQGVKVVSTQQGTFTTKLQKL